MDFSDNSREESVFLAGEDNYCPRSMKKCRFPKWNLAQNKLYLQYLEQEIYEESRGKKFFYKRMSVQVGSRTNQQCRSHHQKMLKTHGNEQQIIQHFKNILKTNQPHQKLSKKTTEEMISYQSEENQNEISKETENKTKMSNTEERNHFEFLCENGMRESHEINPFDSLVESDGEILTLDIKLSEDKH